LNTYELTVVEVFVILKSATVLPISVSSIDIATIGTDPGEFFCPRFAGSVEIPC
jgi:hypothetical protein